MIILNKEIPLGIGCYVVDKKLSDFLQKQKSLSLFSIRDGDFYFIKNENTKRIFEKEIPIFYKIFSRIEES